MISRLLEAAEDFVFDAIMATGMPILIWWCSRGLKREEYTAELIDFWTAYWTPEKTEAA